MERRLDYMKSRRNSDARQISALERTRDARVAELKEGARSLKGMKDRLEAAFGTTVTVRDRIFPGAKISFGLDEFPLGEKGLERVVLRRIAGKTEVHGFKESGVEE